MYWFRRARPGPPSWNLAKTITQIVVFWGVFLFIIPPSLVALAARAGIPATPFLAGRVLAVFLFASASALGLWSALTIAMEGEGTPLPLDSPRRLVSTGPYAWVRNPMAIAGLAQGIAVALWHGSPVVAAYVIAGGLLWHVFVRPLEEADLARTFGEAFVQYRQGVPLWLPRRPRPDASRSRAGT